MEHVANQPQRVCRIELHILDRPRAPVVIRERPVSPALGAPTGEAALPRGIIRRALVKHERRAVGDVRRRHVLGVHQRPRRG